MQINECISVNTFKGADQFFFLAEIISGTFGSGQGEEYTDTNQVRGTYLPTWVDIKSLSSKNVIPHEVSLKVQSLVD